jgi:membrane-associated phospholipid phosphatase
VRHVRAAPLVFVAQLLLVVRLPAQQAPSEPVHTVRWWEAAIAVGVVGLVSISDDEVDRWVQDQRSSHSDDIARVFKWGGEPEVALGIPAAMFVAGLATKSPKLQRGAGRVLGSVALAGVTTGALKFVVGRFRPDEATSQYIFKPFSNHDAFPSGHATIAFGLATSLSEEIRRPWATALLYAGATGTAWSRLNDHKHWLSDVLAGAMIGITSGKVMEGRWRIFGLGPPHFLVEPSRLRLEWRKTF